MASTTASAPPRLWERGEHEVSLARLYVLRANYLIWAVAGLFMAVPPLIAPEPAERWR